MYAANTGSDKNSYFGSVANGIYSHNNFVAVVVNDHENENGSLDVSLEFNGDFKDTSTVCFEIND